MGVTKKRQRLIGQIADRIIAFQQIHYGEKPKYIYMTEDLHRAITGTKSVRYGEEFCGVFVKIFNSSGLKFYLVQEIFEVK